MDAEFTVEMGADAPALELPWSSGDAGQRFYDLRSRPELLLEIPEAANNRPLGEFLAAINTPNGSLQTVKCDTWLSHEITEEEKSYGAAMKFGSYVDLVFTSDAPRQSMDRHEKLARSLCGLLAKAPSISVAAEFILRRCYVHTAELAAGRLPQHDAPSGNSEDAYCLCFYLTGYGDDEEEARKRWMIGLKLVENAILQLAARGI
jgi:hypothetical protein